MSKLLIANNLRESESSGALVNGIMNHEPQ
jgi:hypothetical protein